MRSRASYACSRPSRPPPTNKLQKNRVRREGIDPEEVSDPLYAWTEDGYVPLTPCCTTPSKPAPTDCENEERRALGDEHP